MTKALDDAGGVPIEKPSILIWVLPDAVAFSSEAQRVSKLYLMRASATLVRCCAEFQHRNTHPEGAKLKKKAVAEFAAWLFLRAADEIPLTTVKQDHKADVAIAPAGASGVMLFLSPMIAMTELERATIFLLRATFRGMLESRTVLTPTEFLTWLEELACETVAQSVVPSTEQEPPT